MQVAAGNGGKQSSGRIQDALSARSRIACGKWLSAATPDSMRKKVVEIFVGQINLFHNARATFHEASLYANLLVEQHARAFVDEAQRRSVAGMW